jgi:hypothetical protein
MSPPPNNYNSKLFYDTVVKANKIKVKKINKHQYNIKLNKATALMYQIFNSDSVTLNSSRRVLSVDILKWYFYAFVWTRSEKLFTPTTVMEIDNNKYVFVINNVVVKNGKVIFKVSTKDINYGNLSKLSKISKGHFKNVRFDIDSKTWYIAQSCTQLFGVGSCTPGQCYQWKSVYVSDTSDEFVCPNDDGLITSFNSDCGECCYFSGTTGNSPGCIDEGDA